MTTASPAQPGEHIQVLVVEDNRTFVELVQLLLDAATDINFDVTIANSVQEGLTKLNKDEHDVILLDLHLPNGQGLGLVKLFLDVAGPDIPVVVTSDIDDPQGAAEIIKAGAAEFIAKYTFDDMRLAPLLKAVVERHRSLHRVRSAAQEARSTLQDVRETLDALKDIAPQIPAAVATVPIEKEL